MTIINLNIAEELNGENPYMAIAFIDGYGDVLLKELELGDALVDEYFTPCGECGMPALKFTLGSDLCDHCYKAGIKPCYHGDKYLLDELNLHFRDTWHLAHTGGGCMVAVTDNVAVSGKHYYLAVSGDCVCIYEDTFKQDDFLMEHITAWSFGENPTVLMNRIDEFLGGTSYWDTGKLFDDIMTIGKSDKIA